MRILVVDDNAHHAELVAMRLGKEGWEVTTSDNPEPTDHFRQFDFIILDYNMPKRSGLDVISRMKELDIATPVIFVTGQGNETVASEAIKRGAYDYVVKDTQLHFLDRLPSVIREAKSKHELIETNRFLVQELRRANERLQKMSFTDEMTGIFNYRFIRKQLDTEIQRSQRYDKPLSICIIDIDHFKEINDAFGHQTGDQVLKDLARILSQCTRSVDYVGRYAGDEFVIIFPDTSLPDAIRLCERIRKAVREHSLQFAGSEIRYSLSIGVADFESKKRSSSTTLLEAADLKLYQAKRSGRNRVYSTMKVIEHSMTPEVLSH
jgi:diguanylate cyclase (GGDEF)-like protein